MFDPSPFRVHIEAVETLTAAGIAPPKQWTELLRRYQQFVDAAEIGVGAVQRLADAVTAGQDYGDLLVLAVAEADARPTAVAAVRNAVEARVHARMLEMFPGQAAYEKACAVFDAAAKRFTACAEAVNVHADPDQVMLASDAERQAWADAPLAAQELDRSLALLLCAASLAGRHLAGEAAEFTLTVDPAGVGRREAWAAWDSTGRCGRWGHLVGAGCELRAWRDLAGFAAQQRPAPLQEQWIAVGRGQYQKQIIDPEAVVS